MTSLSSFRRACLGGVCATAIAFTAGQAAAQSVQGAPAPGQHAPLVADSTFGQNAVPGEIIVRFKASAGLSTQAATLAAVGATLVRPLELPNTVLIKVPSGTEASAALSLASDPNILYAEPNRILHADAVPNDPSFTQLWGLRNTGQSINGGAGGTADADIDAVEAWEIGRGLTSNVRVAVIDTGGTTHPDFLQNIFVNPGESGGGKETNHVDDDHNGFVDDVSGWDFVNNDNVALDDNSHGSHVTGTIAGRSNNGVGVAGVASFPTASGQWLGPKIVEIKVLNAAGSGSFTQIAAGMNYAGKIGAKVANMSLGGAGTSQFMDDTIKANPKVLFVVAAGNDGTNNDTFGHTPCAPASLPDAPNKICVAATDNNDQLASFSNFGVKNVDLAAPGVNILSSVPVLTSVFSDTFESGLGKWVTNDAGQTPAGSPRWGLSTAHAVSATHSFADSPAGNYAANQNNWARNKTSLNLTGGVGCRVVGPFYLATEYGHDYLYIQSTKTPANAASWANTTSWTGTGNADFDNIIGFDGQTGVFFRLRLDSDASNQSDGAFVDNVSVSCYKGATGYAYFNGTSMATPHVAGAAAFLFTKFPTATAAQIKDRILRSVDKKAVLNGKLVTGGRLNLYRAAAESAVSVSNHVATFTAGAGETNNVTVTKVNVGGVDKFRFSDPFSTSTTAIQSGSRIIPGAGCTRVNDNVSDCPAAGITRVVVNGGDLNDTLNATTLAIPVTLNGGPGNDTLIGGTKGDILIGGPGGDRFRGGAGNDTINAKNDDVDLEFTCGENSGDSDIVNADLTPNDPITAAPGNCEVVNKS